MTRLSTETITASQSEPRHAQGLARVHSPPQILPPPNRRLADERLNLPPQLMLPADGARVRLDLVINEFWSVAFDRPVDVRE